jgi:branched-chain amino acid transport system ATP-binding protein
VDRGRVKTPTLAIVCKRELEIRNFGSWRYRNVAARGPRVRIPPPPAQSQLRTYLREGVLPPIAGSIVADIDGEQYNLVGRSTEDIVDLGISLVPEGRRLFPKLTVEENLLLGAFRSLARAEITRNLDSSYTTFPALRERRRQLSGSLSGGEQQMLALARALMSAPKILLIDEPSVGLAPVLVKRTIEKIKELKDRYQLTVLMAEQNFNQAVRIADRGYVIVHGKIAFEGVPPRNSTTMSWSANSISGCKSAPGFSSLQRPMGLSKNLGNCDPPHIRSGVPRLILL